MFQDKYVFSQLVSFLDRNHFNYLVRKYGGDRLCEEFHMLESTADDDVQPTFQSRKFAGFDCCSGYASIEVLPPRSWQTSDENDSCQSQSGSGLLHL